MRYIISFKEKKNFIQRRPVIVRWNTRAAREEDPKILWHDADDKIIIMYSTHVLWFKPGGKKKRKLRSDTIANNIKEKMGKMVMHLCVRRCLHTAGPYYTCLVFSGESFLSLFTNSRKNIQHFWKGRANRVALVWRVISREKTLIHHTPTGHTRAPRWCWFSFLSLLLLGIFRWLRTMCGLSI